MLDQTGFYIRHSINDLRVNGQRTFFALLCIAAGVAAIVSLQTLAVMIASTLTGNLQVNNRGDIQLQPDTDFLSSAEIMQKGVDEGILIVETQRFFGQEVNNYRLSMDGLRAIKTRLDEQYPNQAESTYRQSLTDELGIFLANGLGTAINLPATGAQATSVSPIMIDASVYPFYSSVLTTSGKTLDEVLNSPNDIVVNEQIAQTLGIDEKDLNDPAKPVIVRLNGAESNFFVTGIVQTEEEIKDPTSSDIFGALFGFYYLDHSASALFPDIETTAEVVYLKLRDPALVSSINDMLTESFPYLQTKTTDDLRENYTDLADNIDQLVTIMGLLSLLIGSIGIINTMQVIVRRRTVEIAVLKTIGLQANQITILFLVEAVIMGIIGSLAGIVLGWAATFIIRGAAETLLATSLPFVLAPQPAINGFVVGILVTTIFGFLPTLTAGQVRPSIILRPADEVIPRTGRIRTLVALVFIILALTVVTQTILKSFNTALIVTVGAFITAGIMYLILSFLIWLIGRFFPSLGVVDLKISLRQMLSSRGRGAITLLALVVGVFSLSLITLFADSIGNLLAFSLDQAAGGNVIITVASPPQLSRVEGLLGQLDGVNSYQVNKNYNLDLISLEKADTGEIVPIEQLGERVREHQENNSQFGNGNNGNRRINWTQIIQSELGSVGIYDLEQLDTAEDFAAGRQLTAEDAGEQVIVLTDSPRIAAMGIQVNDKLIYKFKSGQNLLRPGASGDEETITFTVIGIVARAGFSISTGTQAYTLTSAFPENRSPNNVAVTADVDDAKVPELRQQLSAVPGTFMLEISIINKLFTSLMGTFTAFPTMVAALGLIVGGIVIANSVALTTLERRREIAVMKSLGLQRERVLGMLLLENAIMGLIGGLIGVGIGLVALALLVANLSVPGSALPVGTALLLMLLCAGVALIAAMTTAWGASGEKPLNVLRYE